MAILKDNPTVDEVLVERVKPIRFAAEQGRFDEVFKTFNQRA